MNNDDINLIREAGLGRRVKASSNKDSDATVILMESGRSKQGIYYSPEILAQLAPMFDGKKMYRDHQDPNDVGRLAHPIDNWVALIRNPRVIDHPDGGVDIMGRPKQVIEADAKFVRDDFKNFIKDLHANSALDDLGISIDIIAQTEDKDINGVPTKVVQHVHTVRCADFVSEASAGGKIRRLTEAELGMINTNVDGGIDNKKIIDNNIEEVTMEGLDKVTIEQLTESRPDLVEAIITNAKVDYDAELAERDELITNLVSIMESDGYVMDEETGEIMQLDPILNYIQESSDGSLGLDIDEVYIVEDEYGDEYDEGEYGDTEQVGVEPVQEGDQLIDITQHPAFLEQQQTIEQLTNTIIAQNEDIAATRAKIEELTNGVVKNETTRLAEQLLQESNLSDESKERIFPAMLACESVDDMVDIINDEATYIQHITEGLATPPVGVTVGDDEEVTPEKRLAAYIGFETDTATA